MNLPEPSEEQRQVIINLATSNVIVNSVAGSGKTTTNLFIANTYANINILLLTYNKKLKLETRERIKLAGLKNIEVHSYHSFCVKYYNPGCITDYEIINVLDTPARRNFTYGIIILDEAQDITPLYYQLIKKIYNDNELDEAKFCVLGDQCQSIYGFNKADERYLIYADKVFNFNELNWVRTNLSTSFRITEQMADFVNICLLKQNKVLAKKSGAKVKYIVCDCFRSYSIYQEIFRLLQNGLSYDDIFILAPSFRGSGKSPAKELANLLTKQKIPIYVPNSDDEKLDADVLMGKIVFSTFHQVKGLERKAVIVYSFDESYLKFYNKTANRNYCPNEIYVACTRALQELIVLHHKANDTLPFIAKSNLAKVCNVEMLAKIAIKSSAAVEKADISVIGLIRHLAPEIVDKALNYVDWKLLENNSEDINFQEKINISGKIQQKDLFENVSDITGTAIPAYYQYMNTKKLSIAEGKVYENIEIPELLKLANEWNAKQSGYKFKLAQISEYSWLGETELGECMNRLRKYISNEASYEVKFSRTNPRELAGKNLTGYIDCIDQVNNTYKVYEFKCVELVEREHFLQLAIYMYLCLTSSDYTEMSDVKYKFYLYNIISDSMYKVKSDVVKLTSMMQYLIANKYGNSMKLTDSEFLEDVEKMKKGLTIENVEDEPMEQVVFSQNLMDDFGNL